MICTQRSSSGFEAGTYRQQPAQPTKWPQRATWSLACNHGPRHVILRGRLPRPREVRRSGQRGCARLGSAPQYANFAFRPSDFIWRVCSRRYLSDSACCPTAATHGSELSRGADPVSADRLFADYPAAPAVASHDAEGPNRRFRASRRCRRRRRLRA